MANSYYFTSASAGLVMDVKGGSTTTPTAIQLWTQDTPGTTNNQLWTFEPDPSGYFFIKSNLGSNIVIDVDNGAKADKGDNLQTNVKSSSDSQLWNIGEVYIPFGGYVTIKSKLGHKFVIDVKGAGTTKKTLIDVWPFSSAKANQLWFLIPVSTNTYNPKITAIFPTAGRNGFTINGAGFQPGTQVFGSYLFADPITGYANNGSLVASTDLGGGFVSDNPADSLATTNSGTLTLQLLSMPMLPAAGAVSASWDGTAFTIK